LRSLRVIFEVTKMDRREAYPSRFVRSIGTEVRWLLSFLETRECLLSIEKDSRSVGHGERGTVVSTLCFVENKEGI